MEENKRLIKPEDFDINDVISDLQGSCKTLVQALEELYEIDESVLTEEDIAYINNVIFLCEGCGWWNDLSEQQDEGLCSDCYEKEVDEMNEDSEEGEDEE